MLKIVFIILALFFAGAAVYHAVGIFTPVNDAPPWRHFVFVCINLFCAYGILARPAYFIYVLISLLGQQMYSHGSAFIRQWQNEHTVDWISLGVLIVLPLVVVLVWVQRRIDARAKRQEPRRSEI